MQTARELNRGLPLTLLKAAALKRSLPHKVHVQLVKAAWTKAYLAKDWAMTNELSGELVSSYPMMHSYVADFDREKDEARKVFLGAFAILHFPGITPLVQVGIGRETRYDKIDNYRDNWWCGRAVRNKYSAGEYVMDDGGSGWSPEDIQRKKGPPEKLSFLTAAERESAASEWSALSSADAGMTRLTKIVMDYQKLQPHEPRMPEAWIWLCAHCGTAAVMRLENLRTRCSECFTTVIRSPQRRSGTDLGERGDVL